MSESPQEIRFKLEVGERLRQARKASDVRTQVEAAELLTKLTGEPIPSSRISNYEQGARLPDPITVQHLADIYGTFASVIYGFNDGLRSKAEAKLVKQFRETDERGKAVITQVAETQPRYPDRSNDPEGEAAA